MDLLEFCNRDNAKGFSLFENVISTNNDSEKINLLEKKIIPSINTKLDRIESHCLGLNLLHKCLPELSAELLAKSFPHWIGKITQILTNAHTDSVELTTVCRTACRLIGACKKVPELDKRVSIHHVKQIIEILEKKYDQNKSEALINLLVALLYYYPESCARFQSKFNKIISSCIDETNDEFVFAGAKCYSLLVKALERSFAHTSKNESIIFSDNPSASCHVSHQISLCNDLCTMLDELFQDLVTTITEFPFKEQNVSKIYNLELSELSCQDLLKYYSDVQNRFTNICTYLSTLLKIGASGGKKFVLPNVILQVVCKGLSITPVNLQRNEEENRKDLLMFILPTIHIGLLNILTDLINSYRYELIPFATILQRLIVQTLDWTKFHKSFQNVRVLSYKTLSLWLQQTGHLAGFQLVADEFLPHLLKDLSIPKKNVVILNKKGSKTSLKSNKKSKESQAAQDCSNEVDTQTYTDLGINLQALATVRSIISNSNLYLKPSFYTEIRNTVVSALHEHYVKDSSPDTNESRLHLIRTLRFLQTYGHNLVPSPTSDAIHIFGKAVAQDQDPEIVEEAKLGLAEIRHIVYPAAPSLMLPLPNATISPPSSRSTSPVQQRDISRLIPAKRDRSFFKDTTDESIKRSKTENSQKKEETLNGETNERLESLKTNGTVTNSQPEENSDDKNDSQHEEEKEEDTTQKSTQVSQEAVQEFKEAAQTSAEKKNESNGKTRSTKDDEPCDDDDDMLLAFCDVTNS